MTRTRTLVVTNDFPPRRGGIETFVRQLTDRFPADGVVVLTSSEPGAADHDAALPYPVVRHPAHTLLPVPSVGALAVATALAHGCDRVWFGAAAPLGLLAPVLRRSAGVVRAVATTHGHEVWWARTPGTRSLLRRIGTGVDVITCLGPRTRAPIAAALAPGTRVARLVPGVDTDAFRPDPGRAPHPGTSGTERIAVRTTGRIAGGERIRERYGLGRRPVVLCTARLVPRKGQDTLIRALPWVRRVVPDALLLLVGDGPYERELRRLADSEGVTDAVVFAGGHPHTAMPDFCAAADVFAMPCRSRRRGLEVEGLGIVFLEAAAAGLPVVAGDSGGAPDAVLDGESGYVVDGRSVAAVGDRLVRLIQDGDLARDMGERGRRWVASAWDWDRSYETLAGLLEITPADRPG
ncbi:glycosyltransferase family 4 protein [Streptomyces sp. NPDC000594]|uniref:glycosyltransferase family 4 protein n=1 Tax=Streptomyces sp. NPDC000594 TaxID=3154261 RepID=UPI003329C8EF